MNTNKIITLVAVSMLCLLQPINAQNDKLKISAEQLPQALLRKADVPPGDYSGISHIRGDLYAVVSDKEPLDGFYPFTIQIDSLTGKIQDVHRNGIVGHRPVKTDINGSSLRDAEDIVYHPSTDTYFISGEGDQRILEFNNKGRLTGRELNIPHEFSINNIQPNYGFEALAYDSIQGLFWTTTEAALKKDKQTNDDTAQYLRLQAFGEDLQPLQQYAYKTDTPSIKSQKSRRTFGVSALTALPDGRLLVLERDFIITKSKIGSYVNHKIFLIDPLKDKEAIITSDTDMKTLSPSHFLKKELLTEFTTKLTLFTRNIANFEGMCLGPTLKDGRRVLLLVNDSQHNYGNLFFHLQDYIKVILLKFQ